MVFHPRRICQSRISEKSAHWIWKNFDKTAQSAGNGYEYKDEQNNDDNSRYRCNDPLDHKFYHGPEGHPDICYDNFMDSSDGNDWGVSRQFCLFNFQKSATFFANFSIIQIPSFTVRTCYHLRPHILSVQVVRCLVSIMSRYSNAQILKHPCPDIQTLRHSNTQTPRLLQAE